MPRQIMPRQKIAARTTARLAAGLGLALAASTLVGCSSVVSAEDRAATRQIRWNPSPAMTDLDSRQVDIHNDIALVVDTNLRHLRRDLREFWLLESPSHLTRVTIPR